MNDELAEKIRRVFSDAAILTFEKMTCVTLVPAQAGPAEYDLSAIIGFTGDMAGNCALRLSHATAQEVVNRLAGEDIDSTVEVADGAGELVNMIAGNAKASLQEYALSLSFPEVIRGRGHEIGFHRHPSIVSVYFTSEIGAVAVIIAFSEPTSGTR